MSVLVLAVTGPRVWAQQQPRSGQSEGDLAQQLSNPVANQISVPFQNNFDFGSNSSTQTRWLMNVQPVIPFMLNQNWNLITRTIMPIQFREMASRTNDLFGLGDTSESLFLSPRGGSIIWGGSPIVQLPTATDGRLGSGKFSWYHANFMWGLRIECKRMTANGLVHGESGCPVSLTLIIACLLFLVGLLAAVSMIFDVGQFG